LAESKQSLQDSTAKLGEAKAAYDSGTNDLRIARNQHDDARTALKSAKTNLEGAEAKYSQAQRTAADATISLTKAEGLANRSEERLNKATENEEKAKAAYYKAQDVLRTSTRFALVALIAALSIAAWGLTGSITAGRYIALVPVLSTALAIGVGVYAWRKAQ